MKRLSGKQAPIAQTAAVLGCLTFLGGLALFAFAGAQARYWADDYCYSAVMRDSGFFGGLRDWYLTSGSRLATAALVSVSEWFGPLAIRFIPTIMLALWVAGWWVFLSRLARTLGWQGLDRWAALIALAQVYFAALLAPDRLQTLYWRLGALHYTFPMALLLLNLGWLLGRWQRGATWGLMLCSAALAFFAGLSSEVYDALQVGVFGLLLATGVFWLILRRDIAWRQALLPLGGLIGGLLAMLVMALSPSTAWRQAAMPPPDSLLELISYSLRYSVDFVLTSLRGQPVPNLVLAALIGLIALLVFAQVRPQVRAGWAAAGIPLSLVVGFLLIVCSVAPSVYAGLFYPAGRALMPARFALLLGISGAAAFAAALAYAWLARRLGGNPLPARVILPAAALLLVVCAYPVRALPLQQAEIRALQARAQRFDLRHAQIVSEVAMGIRDIQVRQVDVVWSLVDIDPDPENWVNRCAAAYYHVDTIQAIP